MTTVINNKAGEFSELEKKELMDLARKTHDMVVTAVSKLEEIGDKQEDLKLGQSAVVQVLEELKPLSTLPAISQNLTNIVERLITPATEKKIWPYLAIIFVQLCIVIFLVYKNNTFEGSADVAGNKGTFKSTPYHAQSYALPSPKKNEDLHVSE